MQISTDSPECFTHLEANSEGRNGGQHVTVSLQLVNDPTAASIAVTLRCGEQMRDLIIYVGPNSQEPGGDNQPNTIRLPNVLLSTRETYQLSITTEMDTAPSYTMSEGGIVAITDVQRIDLSYFYKLEPLQVGTTEISFSAGDFTHRVNVTVVQDAPTLVAEGELIKSMTVDKTDATVYYDDTAVTYTVVTDTSVTSLHFELVARDGHVVHSYRELQRLEREMPDRIFAVDALTVTLDTLRDTLTNTGTPGSFYTASAQIVDGMRVWTVQWDLGETAVEMIRVTAATAAGEQHRGYAHLNIAYPVFDPTDSLEELLLLWMSRNMTDPLFFTVDESLLSEEQRALWEQVDPHLIFEEELQLILGYYMNEPEFPKAALEYYDIICDGSPLYRHNSISEMPAYSLVRALTYNRPSNVEEYPYLNGKNRLTTQYYLEGPTFMLYMPLNDEMRAVMSYLHGFEIDAEKFTYAHNIR